jgi:hypothetical protein
MNLREDGHSQQTLARERNELSRKCRCAGARRGDPADIGLQDMTVEQTREVLDAAGSAFASSSIDCGFAVALLDL